MTDTDPVTPDRKPAHKRTRNTSSGVKQLTDAQVHALRLAYWVDFASVADICVEFGDDELGPLPQSSVYAAARGASYKHLPMPDGVLPGASGEPLPRRKKYSDKVLEAIRADFKAGRPVPEIAKARKVPYAYVRAVLQGKFRPDGEGPLLTPESESSLDQATTTAEVPANLRFG